MVNPSGTPGASIQSIEYWTVRGWTKEEAQKEVSAAGRRACIFSPDYYLAKGYSEEDAKKAVSEVQRRNCGFHIDHWLAKGYSEEEALEMIESTKILAKQNQYKYIPDYWIAKGFPEDEATELALYYKLKLKEANPTCVEYWVERGYSITDAIANANSYNPASIHYWLKRFDDPNKAEIARQKFLRKRRAITTVSQRRYRSKVANTCLSAIREAFPKATIITVDEEFCLRDIKNSTHYYYDYTDQTNRVIIEFNGDYWHSHPNNVEKDIKKRRLAEDNGYKVFYIWESEYAKKSLTDHCGHNQSNKRIHQGA